MRSRRDRLRERLAEACVDGLVVTSLPNLRYLTGFTGSNGALFLSASDPDDDVLATDGRYATQVAVESPDLPVLIERDSLGILADQIAGHGATRVLAEDGATSAMVDAIRRRIRDVSLAHGLVEELRIVKDSDELDLLARACAITARAMTDIAAEIGPGWTEIAVARRLEQRFGELGAEDRAFSSIVAAGPNSARPHHRPTDRALAAGDLVVIDAGARVGGYHADMTRTYVVGAAAEWQREIHACVAEAAARARAAAIPDAELVTVDAAARDWIGEAGWGAQFVHGLGHGVGLEVHEAPMISGRAIGRLSASTPVTIEPGIYLADRGGVRIEDTIVVGQGVLTEADRTLISVG